MYGSKITLGLGAAAATTDRVVCVCVSVCVCVCVSSHQLQRRPWKDSIMVEMSRVSAIWLNKSGRTWCVRPHLPKGVCFSEVEGGKVERWRMEVLVLVLVVVLVVRHHSLYPHSQGNVPYLRTYYTSPSIQPVTSGLTLLNSLISWVDLPPPFFSFPLWA
jgi:hypothetical protein